MSGGSLLVKQEKKNPILFVIDFLWDSYSYVPETNHVSRVCSVAPILCLQRMARVMLFPMLIFLYFYISTSGSTCTVPSMAVFCSSFISCFPYVRLRY